MNENPKSDYERGYEAGRKAERAELLRDLKPHLEALVALRDRLVMADYIPIPSHN